MKKENPIRQKRDYLKQLHIDGRSFPSVTDFCAEYDLGYRTTLSLLKEGRNASEIVQMMLELPDVPKKIRRDGPVVFEGVPYATLTEACRKLGLKKERVYNFLRQGLSVEEAIAKSRELQKKYEKNPDRRTGSKGSRGDSCTIDGVFFKTQKDACKAFHVPYPSVMARMQRHPGMPFEEALLRGAKKWRYVAPVRRPNLSSGEPAFQFSMANGDDPDIPILLKVEDALVSNDYGNPGDFLCKWNKEPEQWSLEFNAFLHPPSDCKKVEVFQEAIQPSFAQSFQFFVRDFYSVPKDSEEKCHYLEFINKVQKEFAGVTLTVSGDTICASGLFTTSGTSFSSRLFMFALHRFLGTTAAMHTMFLDEFGTKK